MKGKTMKDLDITVDEFEDGRYEVSFAKDNKKVTFTCSKEDFKAIRDHMTEMLGGINDESEETKNRSESEKAKSESRYRRS